MLIVLVGGLFLLGLLTWFYMLEIDGDRHTIFVVLAVVFLVEAVIAGGGASVPVGLLRPQFGGQDFRPPDIVIVAAMGAHLLAGRLGRIGPLSFAWFPFLAVYLGGVAIGVLNNLSINLILFEGKAVFYLIGGAMVASGVDTERLMESVGRVGLVLAPVVPIALAIRVTGLEFNINTPVQRLTNLGAISNDTISILVALGAVVVVAECVRKEPSYLRISAGAALLLAPLSGEQRASYLSLVAVLVALVGFVSGRTWNVRSTVRPAQLALVAGGLTAVMLVGFLTSDTFGVVSLVDDAFGGVGNEQSAEARTLLYAETMTEISRNPIIGSGVGAQVTTTVQSGELTTSPHNVVLELLLRVGVIGLVTFVIAVGATWVVAIRVWRWAPTAATAAVGASVVIVFAAVLAKAMVEPALNKFRLSLFLGMALGCLAAAERVVLPAVERARAGAFGLSGRGGGIAAQQQSSPNQGGNP
jgi:O-antigen ligase